MSENLGVPLDKSLREIKDIPYTLSFCIKKSKQIDSFFELPKDKQPPESIWDDSQELKYWFDNLYNNEPNQLEFDLGEVEG